MKGGEAAGSVAGGGRYDRLIGLYGGKNTPATGISFSVERIAGVLKGRLPKTTTQVMVISVNDRVREDCLTVARKLREQGLNAETDLAGRNLSKQFGYADSLGIPYTLVVGEKELKSKAFGLKDMKTGKEKKVRLEDVAKVVCK